MLIVRQRKQTVMIGGPVDVPIHEGLGFVSVGHAKIFSGSGRTRSIVHKTRRQLAFLQVADVTRLVSAPTSRIPRVSIHPGRADRLPAELSLDWSHCDGLRTPAAGGAGSPGG